MQSFDPHENTVQSPKSYLYFVLTFYSIYRTEWKKWCAKRKKNKKGLSGLIFDTYIFWILKFRSNSDEHL